MKFLIPVTFSILLAVIIYLVVDRSAGVPTGDGDSGAKESSTSTINRSRTPHLVSTLIDPSQHLDEQIEAIRALPTDLSEGEFQSLMALLYDDIPETMNAATWSTLQNEIMEVLRQRRFDLPQYPEVIAGILSDREASPIMRDYAAQHLTLYLRDRGATLDEPAIHHSLDALLSVLIGSREAGQQVAGTTLMALSDLDQKQPQLLESHRPALNQAVLNLLDFETPVTFSNRISAIQAAGRLKVSEALPQVRKMAASEEIKPSFKLSSIASLGYYAQPEDQPLLEGIAQSQTRYRFAAQTALKSYPSTSE